MRKIISWSRYKLASLAGRIENALNGPARENPVYVEWMGSDICYRLLAIKDALGDVLDNPDGTQNYERLRYNVDDDHEHCDACWARIYKDVDEDWATSEYYSNENSDDGVQGLFCPVCFVLFEAVCKGVLKVEITNPDALMPYELDQEHWRGHALNR